MTMFGSPLSAGPAVTNPAQKLDLQNLGPGVNQVMPTALTMYDVSAFTGAIVRVFPNNYGAGVTTLATNFYDVAGQIVGALQKAPQNVSVNTSNGNGLLWFVKTLGPQMQITIDSVPAAAGLDVHVFGTNMVPRFDGPYTPSEEGRQVVIGARVMAGPGVATVPLADYIGPAILYGEAVSGTVAAVGLQNLAGLTFAKIDLMRSAAGPAFDQVQLWVPPEPCKVVLVTGAAQTLNYALVAN